MSGLSIAVQKLWSVPWKVRTPLTIFTDEAEFVSAIDSTRLNAENFDSPSVIANRDWVTLEHFSVNARPTQVFCGDKSDSVSAENNTLIWLRSATSDLMFVFHEPINAFAVTVKDLGYVGSTACVGSTALSVKVDGGEVQKVFAQVEDTEFLALVNYHDSFSCVTFTNSCPDNCFGFERLRWGKLPAVGRARPERVEPSRIHLHVAGKYTENLVAAAK